MGEEIKLSERMMRKKYFFSFYLDEEKMSEQEKINKIIF